MVPNFFSFAKIWTRLINGRFFGVRLDQCSTIGRVQKNRHDINLNGCVCFSFVDFVLPDLKNTVYCVLFLAFEILKPKLQK